MAVHYFRAIAGPHAGLGHCGFQGGVWAKGKKNKKTRSVNVLHSTFRPILGQLSEGLGRETVNPHTLGWAVLWWNICQFVLIWRWGPHYPSDQTPCGKWVEGFRWHRCCVRYLGEVFFLFLFLGAWFVCGLIMWEIFQSEGCVLQTGLKLFLQSLWGWLKHNDTSFNISIFFNFRKAATSCSLVLFKLLLLHNLSNTLSRMMSSRILGLLYRFLELLNIYMICLYHCLKQEIVPWSIY